MVKRPANWETMTSDEQMKWLRKQRHECKGGRRRKIKSKDKEKVWGLMRTYENKSLVAQMLGVSRVTVLRFLKRFPISDTFQIEKNVEHYSEIKVWLTRQRAFSKEAGIKGHLRWIQNFHNYMKEKHPKRTHPKLWTSDDILEFVQTFRPYQQHNVIVALRQLAKKCPTEFPLIDLGLLPTRKTHKAKRSLAGKEEYYLTIDQIRKMIKRVPCSNREAKARNKAIISLLFNTACRTGDALKGLGLLGIRIEDLNLDGHSLRMKDKGDIMWHVLGLSDDTVEYLRKYLKERGDPSTGFLFTNGKGTPMSARQVNRIIRQAGKNAGIKGKRLVAKTFRKSLVRYALEECGISPTSLIGTGKQSKTCFCVGWSDMDVLMSYYAPKLEKQIEKERKKFTF